MITRPDQFAWPWAFALLVIPALYLLFFWASGSGAAVGYAAQRFVADGPRGWRTRLMWLPRVLRALSLAAVAVAIARPQTITGEVRTRTEGIAIQLVVDRSSSMNEPMKMDGAELTRMEVVKRVAKSFVMGDEASGLGGREGDLIGMISFAKYADTVCPLVREHETLSDLIEKLRTAVIRSEDGTAIGEAVALAAARLRHAEDEVAASVTDDRADDDTPNEFSIASKAIVLLTDGQNNQGEIDPLAAARLAADYGIRVYAIGIGGGRMIELPGFSRRVGPSVDERTLRQIAEITGGRYWLAEDAETLREIYAEIDDLETTEIESSVATNTEERFAPYAAAGLGLVCLETLLATLVFRRTP
ncbi:MAG: aerotolerance regulator BatA [Phycisphaerae bacterium]|nr:aerotolerance regulator BatA [Phycisphaerae bacterium]